LQYSKVSGEDIFGVEENIKQLKEDIDLRNAQIADLQQKILDSDQGKPLSVLFLLHDMLKFF
jgi:hypothetical protein